MARKYIKNCTGDDCEIEQKRNFSVVSVFIFYALLISFIGVSLYVLFFSQYLQVLNVAVSGTRELSGSEIQQRVEISLQEKFLGVLPKSNFILVSQNKIEKFLKDDHKKIREVRVIKKFPDTVEIVIDERKALLVWCSGEKCYLLDEKGTAYADADFSSPELTQNNLMQINDTSGRGVTIGSNVINPDYEQYVLSIKDALGGVGFDVSGQYNTPSRMAEEINVGVGQDSEIRFSTQFSLESAMKTLATIVKKEIPENKKGDIDYIDLRNANKAFYRFKEAEPLAENTESENIQAEKNEEQQN